MGNQIEERDTDALWYGHRCTRVFFFRSTSTRISIQDSEYVCNTICTIWTGKPEKKRNEIHVINLKNDIHQIRHGRAVRVTPRPAVQISLMPGTLRTSTLCVLGAVMGFFFFTSFHYRLLRHSRRL